jgi:hypothetical protein
MSAIQTLNLNAPEAQKPSYGEHFEDLPQPLKDALYNLTRTYSKQELWPRRWEVRSAQLQRLYSKNIQNLSGWDNDKGTYKVNASGNGGIIGSNSANQPTSRKVFNIYLGYKKSFIAVFSQNPPNARFEPQNPKEARDIKAAQAANSMRRVVEKFNNPKNLQMDVADLLWTDGRVVFVTDYVIDGEQFGYDESGKPMGREVIEVFGVLESKVLIASRNMREWPYCQISRELDVNIAKDKYNWVADKITPGSKSSMDDDLSRNARISTMDATTSLSQDGSSLATICTEDRWWFRKAAFRNCNDTVRKQLEEVFPEGVRVTFVGSTFCEAKPESMDLHLEVLHANTGKGQNRKSLGEVQVPLQDSFNESMNLVEETIRYGVPATFFDEAVIDTDALQEQISQPGNYYPVERKGDGTKVADAFYRETPTEASATTAEYLQNLQGPLSQFLTGQQPALFGAQMEDQKTARGYAMARNQAMGLMAIVWIPFKESHSKVMLQAVMASRNRSSDVVVQLSADNGLDSTETVEVAIDDLNGNVLCYPETDENFPESWADKSGKIMQIVEMAAQNPVVAQFLMLPDNLAMVKDALGLEDFVIPQADSQEKQLSEIAELLKLGKKLSQAPAEIVAQAGADPEELDMQIGQSMVPVDPVFDEHEFEFTECKRWINSPEGQRTKVENPTGFKLVQAHATQHQAIMQQQAQIAQVQAQQAAMASQPPTQTEGQVQ